VVKKKAEASEEFCFSCETLLLLPGEKHGPICSACYKKLRSPDRLTAAALAQTLVAVVPAICPHGDDRRHGDCKFLGDEARHFNVIVLDKNLDPQQITGPFSGRSAARIAKQIRSKIGRKRK